MSVYYEVYYPPTDAYCVIASVKNKEAAIKMGEKYIKQRVDNMKIGHIKKISYKYNEKTGFHERSVRKLKI